jgi:hypothetical protein
MKITRKSITSGVVRTLDLPISEDQIREWNNGKMIQDAMPNLSPSEREFVMTGIVQEEWDRLFKEEE